MNKSDRSTTGTIALAALLGTTLAACAAERSPAAKAPASAEASPAGYPPPAPATPGQAPPGAYPQQPQPGMAPPPPAPSGGSASSSRSLALQSAARDVDTSQRELDVAAGDCQNACRALGSMDRAAGKVCQLATGDGEGNRCDDAKQRVYNARARVKTTCGQCSGVSVERTDPIPSSR